MSQICCKTVYDRSMNFPRPHGCRNTATKQHEGNWYCAVHHPESVANRRSKSDEKYQAMIQGIRQKHDLEAKNARRLALFDELVSMLQTMLDKDQRNTCRHEETHRVGIIWTICDQCGKQWADDEGGKADFEEPKEWGEAENLLQKARAIP